MSFVILGVGTALVWRLGVVGESVDPCLCIAHCAQECEPVFEEFALYIEIRSWAMQLECMS